MPQISHVTDLTCHRSHMPQISHGTDLTCHRSHMPQISLHYLEWLKSK